MRGNGSPIAFMGRFLIHPKRGYSDLRRTFKESCAYEEIFVEQVYHWLFQRITAGTILLDIGAWIGDTASYFAMNPNVKHVLSFEINPDYVDVFNDAVSKSPFKSKIRLVRRPLLDSDGLNHLLKSLRNVAIKCDIEGWEHKIFSQETNLDNVYAIQIEYHNGVKNLKRILREKSFEVLSKRGKREGYGHGENQGYIYAWRRG